MNFLAKPKSNCPYKTQMNPKKRFNFDYRSFLGRFSTEKPCFGSRAPSNRGPRRRLLNPNPNAEILKISIHFSFLMNNNTQYGFQLRFLKLSELDTRFLSIIFHVCACNARQMTAWKGKRRRNVAWVEMNKSPSCCS